MLVQVVAQQAVLALVLVQLAGPGVAGWPSALYEQQQTRSGPSFDQLRYQVILGRSLRLHLQPQLVAAEAMLRVQQQCAASRARAQLRLQHPLLLRLHQQQQQLHWSWKTQAQTQPLQQQPA